MTTQTQPKNGEQVGIQVSYYVIIICNKYLVWIMVQKNNKLYFII